MYAKRTTKAGTIERRIDLGTRVREDMRLECVATVTEMTHGKNGSKTKQDFYALRKLVSQIGGIGFEVSKRGDAEVRHVLLNAPDGGHTCTCEWGTYKMQTTGKLCRHVECCLQAIKEGKV